MRMQWEIRKAESLFWVREGQTDTFVCHVERLKNKRIGVENELTIRDLMVAAITFPGAR
jgi:hypothetical protein